MYNIYIRPLQIEDALISYKWRNDEEVWKYTGSKPDREITQEIETEWIKKVISEKNSKRFAIIADEQYIGNIQLTNITEKTATYHIFIGNKDFWGKGISQLATFQILNYAKRILNLENIILEVKADNIAAHKSYLKCGFEKTGEREEWILMNYSTNNTPPPTVSVFVMVYNHGPYLKQCIEGILMQKANFNIEIVVGEDCSTDNSREILLDYQAKFPGKFNLILHQNNVGANKNQEIVLQNCIGEYVAICEGDDYWTDPLKLQKQVDFLEENEDFGLVITNVDFYHQEDNKFERSFLTLERFEENSNIKNFLQNKFYMAPCTWLFRSELIKGKIDDLHCFTDGTYILYASFLINTKVQYLPDATAVYRIITESASHSTSQFKLYEREISLYNADDYICKRYEIEDLLPELKQTYAQRLLPIFERSLNDISNDSIMIYEDLAKNNKSILFDILSMQFNKTHRIKLENTSLKKQIHNLYNSKSFKIGRVILSPFRIFKN